MCAASRYIGADRGGRLRQAYPKKLAPAREGAAYQKPGKTALAREAWKKALEIDPSDTTVAEALRALKEE
jgi:predicted TPR repeat methyltransferase